MTADNVDWGVCSGHLSKRSMQTAWPFHNGAGWLPSVHADCPHNELSSLAMRMFCPTPAPSRPEELHSAFKRIQRLARAYPGERWTLEQTARSYTGSMGRRYTEALRSLREDSPLCRRDHRLKPFLKAEKFNLGEKFSKPRMIFPRSPRYNLVLASYLKPFEHWLWRKLTSERLFGCGVGRVVAKGLNQRERADLIHRKFSQFDECVVVEVDGKSFEAHISADQLREEHGVYRKALGSDKELGRLLDAQLVLEGRTKWGVEFRREGGRASGDFNTGMGNTIIMASIASHAMLSIVGARFDMLVDGDNALLFMPANLLETVRIRFPAEVLAVSGHEMTVEKPAHILEQIRFGQSAPVFVDQGYVMVRDPMKILSQASSSHYHLREPKFAREWLRGVAQCEVSLNRGVPISGAWSWKLRQACGGVEKVREGFHTDYHYLGARKDTSEHYTEVGDEARASFWLAYGISPDEQRVLEELPVEVKLDQSPRVVDGLYAEMGGDDPSQFCV